MKLDESLRELHALENLAGKQTAIHRLPAWLKLSVTLAFIVAVMTFARDSFYALAPLVLAPTIAGAFAELPYKLLLKRFALALPFALFGGISVLIFDANGIIVCLTILLKTYLCVMSALILVGTTRFTEIARVLRRIHVPAAIVTTLELTYRYIGVLLEEASSMSRAYRLRSRKSSLEMRHMGSFLGQLVLKTFDRAERVYSAMKCRGY